jgi:hypothetical protein
MEHVENTLGTRKKEKKKSSPPNLQKEKIGPIMSAC